MGHLILRVLALLFGVLLFLGAIPADGAVPQYGTCVGVGTTEGLDCTQPCASGCALAVPVPHPAGGSYSWCFCESGGGGEPRCCHVIVRWLGQWPAAYDLGGFCGGTCPYAGECAMAHSIVEGGVIHTAYCLAEL